MNAKGIAAGALQAMATLVLTIGMGTLVAEETGGSARSDAAQKEEAKAPKKPAAAAKKAKIPKKSKAQVEREFKELLKHEQKMDQVLNTLLIEKTGDHPLVISVVNQLERTRAMKRMMLRQNPELRKTGLEEQDPKPDAKDKARRR